MEPNVEHESSLSGIVISSDVQAGIQYRLIRYLGEGAMGVAYFAQRESRAGASPVVIKAVRPHQMLDDIAPELLARKEAVALGRLNDWVPPSPFVVRFIDTGSAAVFGARKTPWLAIEYVHGGVEGTTLDDRVTYSVHRTGYAFDPARAAHAVRCLAAGLTAIHNVDVIHRDLTPGNVLCCGFGETEIFKISDFGTARPEGLDRTFGDVGVGTVGYAAPEQARPGTWPIRPYTDVFALACVTYYLLTGYHYFEGANPVVVYEAQRSGLRRSLRESNVLSPEISERPGACEGIERLLARATACNPPERPPTAERFASELFSWLTVTESAPRSSQRLMTAMLGVRQRTDPTGWSWTVRQLPRSDISIRSAAWDTDERCFAVTNAGPRFWNGEAWRDASHAALPQDVRFVRRYEAGGWLVGGQASRLALVSADGVHDMVTLPDAGAEILSADGRPDELLVVVGRLSGGPPLLYCSVAGAWLEPLALDGVAYLAPVVPIDRERWLIGGRLEAGGGFVAEYCPRQRCARVLPTPANRAYVAGAGASERGVALMVGSHGQVWRATAEQGVSSVVSSQIDLTAAALDILDREWVASMGALWSRAPATDATWRPVWKDARWQAPFVSLMADSGVVVAMTADGGIVEGRDITRSKNSVASGG